MQSLAVRRLSARIRHAILQTSTSPGSAENRPTAAKYVYSAGVVSKRPIMRTSLFRPIVQYGSRISFRSRRIRSFKRPMHSGTEKKRPDWCGRSFYRLNLKYPCRSNGIRQTVEQSRPEHSGILVDKTNDDVEICHYHALFLRRPLHIALKPSGQNGHLNLEFQCSENSSL